MATTCTHLDQIKVTKPTTHVCEECVKMGDRWVHLRMCLICGNVGCCDSSKNKHATKHFRHVGHPLIRSIEPGERWMWCYVDEIGAGRAGRVTRHADALPRIACHTTHPMASSVTHGDNSLRNHAVEAPHAEHARLDVA